MAKPQDPCGIRGTEYCHISHVIMLKVHDDARAREGDVVIVQERYNRLTYIKLKRDAYLDNRYGRFAHNDVIGKQLGLRWMAEKRPGKELGRSCAGFVYALAPSPELWALALDNRTQVVYPHDASIVALNLELTPGKVIIESGTGSGAATTVFARAVAPQGKVLSFEFHEERALAAREDMKLLGLDNIVNVFVGVDVMKNGFKTVEDGFVDAVFLDLPAPYDMIDETARVLKSNGSMCSFSPCIEQVKKTCERLRDGPFHSIRTITCPLKTYETKERYMTTAGFDELFPENEENGDVDDSIVPPTTSGEDQKDPVSCTARRTLTSLEDGHKGKIFRSRKLLKSRPFDEMKGHTSYLTFATRLGRDMRSPSVNGA